MSDQHKDAERAHCEAVARAAWDEPPVNMLRLADLLECERATARAQGRTEALEEAAAECLAESKEWGGGKGWDGAYRCYERIRALKEKP